MSLANGWTVHPDGWARNMGGFEAAWAAAAAKGELQLVLRFDALLSLHQHNLTKELMHKAVIWSRFLFPAWGVETRGDPFTSPELFYPRVDESALLLWAEQTVTLHHAEKSSVEDEADELYRKAHTTPLPEGKMITLTLVTDGRQMTTILHVHHSICDLWGAAQAYMTFYRCLTILLTGGEVPPRNWGEEAKALPQLSFRVLKEDLGVSDAQVQAAHQWVGSKMQRFQGMTPHHFPLNKDFDLAQPLEVGLSMVHLATAETQALTRRSKELGVTVTVLLLASIWTAMKYLELSHPEESGERGSFFFSPVVTNDRRFLSPARRDPKTEGWAAMCASSTVLFCPSTPGEYSIQAAKEEAIALVPLISKDLAEMVSTPFGAFLADTVTAEQLKGAGAPMHTVCHVSSVGVLDREGGMFDPVISSPNGQVQIKTYDFDIRAKVGGLVVPIHPYTVGGRMRIVSNFNARAVKQEVVDKWLALIQEILLNM